MSKNIKVKVTIAILKPLRKIISGMQHFADFMDDYIKSAKEDTYEIVDGIIDRTQEITEKIELANFIKLLTFLVVILSFVTLFSSAYNTMSLILFDDRVDISAMIIGFAILLVNIFYFAWQALLIFQYKPCPAASDADLPTCTVIVPAYNEGKHVLITIDSLLKSDYPVDKLEVIAVNDGSKDDTWEWMSKGAAESNGRVKAVNLVKNGGKRGAVGVGVRMAMGDIVVTVDSDSIVTPVALRNLMSPFVGDKKIGAVAGNIRVLNLDEGILPKMLDVNFVFSFEFIRSAQSVIRSVLCTPGALSAYRKNLVLNVLDEWLTQKFWGKPANIGEDRALTNMLIRDGYDIVFQQNAVVYTNVPITYRGLCKMFLRWERSNIRENFSMCSFVFKRFDLEDENLLGIQINIIMSLLWMITPLFFILFSLYALLIAPAAFLYGSITMIIFWSTIPAFVYASRYSRNEALWSYVYGVFNFLALSWVGPYSLITIFNSGWLTRDAVKSKAVPPPPAPTPGGDSSAPAA